jgi:hypothetical protein
MIEVPVYIWVIVFLAAVGIPAATSVGLYRGAKAAGASRRSAGTTAALAGTVFGAWLAASALLADHGVYDPASLTAVPWFVIAFAGTFVVSLAATRVPAISRALSTPGTTARLAVPHTFRVAGVAFLIVAGLGHLPLAFALPAGLGDIATGLSAPFVARRLARGEAHREAVWFNVFGLVDLVVALSMGALTGIGTQQILHVSPSSQALSLLPLAMIPTTAVPLLLALHVVALRKLATAPRTAQVSAGIGWRASQPSRTS